MVLAVPDEPARGRKPVLRDELAAVVVKQQYPPERLLNSPQSSLLSLEVVYGYIFDTSVSLGGGKYEVVNIEEMPSLEYMGCGGPDKPCRDAVLGCGCTLKTQSDIDNLSDCEIAVKGVEINSSGGIDLRPLSKLRRVGGDLRINATQLVTLEGLNNVETASSLRLTDNTSLKDLSALNCIGLENVYFNAAAAISPGSLLIVNNSAHDACYDGSLGTLVGMTDSAGSSANGVREICSFTY